VSKLVEPHGGDGLRSLLLPQAERAEELERARGLKQVPMTSREVSDTLMMAMGAYTPLRRVSRHEARQRRLLADTDHPFRPA
jgi:sulfate adenylyltransferase